MKTSKGVGFYSATVFKHAILKFYSANNLIPKGMCVEMDCMQKWSLKMGLALRRMVSCLNIVKSCLSMFVSSNNIQ